MPRLGFLLVAFFVWLTLGSTMPPSVRAECARWDMSGEWTVDQGNGFRVVFYLTQTGDTITGNANYGMSQHQESKSLSGTISSNRVSIKVVWFNGTVAVYAGSLDSRGHWGPGTTYDKTHYSSPSSWKTVHHNDVWGNVPAKCLAEAAPPASASGSGGVWAAIAVDGNGRWGHAVGQPSQTVASSVALQGCGDSACKILDAQLAQCIAYAESRQGGYWFAAYLGQDLMTVQANALNACMKSAPAGSCRLVKARCN